MIIEIIGLFRRLCGKKGNSVKESQYKERRIVFMKWVEEGKF